MSDFEAVNAVTRTVTEEEFLNMARRSSEEIKALRAQIQFLAPRAQAYDCIATILGGLAQPPQVMGEDLVNVLDARVEFLTRQANAPLPGAALGNVSSSSNLRKNQTS